MKLKLQRSILPLVTTPSRCTKTLQFSTQVDFFLIVLVFFRATYPGGSTADKLAAGNMGCPARPQSQRLIGKPCGPAPRQSGAGRNPWPLDRKG